MRFPLASTLRVAFSAIALARAVAAQAPGDERYTWQLEGLTTGWCVQLLLDPATVALDQLPKGYHLLAAGQDPDVHASLQSVVQSQGELAGWSPSALCFYAVDTVHTSEFTFADRSGRHPALLALWSAAASDSSGQHHHVLLDIFTSNGRLLRAARRTGIAMREAKLTMGKVPAEDEDGRPSTDDRFQVKMGKTLITWDGRLAEQGREVPGEVAIGWVQTGDRGAPAPGGLMLRPASSRPMIGALKVEGKDALAKALKASPSRFAGPDYRGGTGTLRFRR